MQHPALREQTPRRLAACRTARRAAAPPCLGAAKRRALPGATCQRNVTRYNIPVLYVPFPSAVLRRLLALSHWVLCLSLHLPLGVCTIPPSCRTCSGPVSSLRRTPRRVIACATVAQALRSAMGPYAGPNSVRSCLPMHLALAACVALAQAGRAWSAEAINPLQAGLLVAEVLSLERHPKADRLQVAILNVGRLPVRVRCVDVHVALRWLWLAISSLLTAARHVCRWSPARRTWRQA